MSGRFTWTLSVQIILIILSTSIIFIYAIKIPVSNAQTYTPLESEVFKDFNTATPTENKLADFLVNIFNFGIAAAVALALIMIIWGGIEYMTTDSWTGKEGGKEKITNALWGLGLALVSYLILYTINPCLVVFTDKEGCGGSAIFLWFLISISTFPLTPFLPFPFLLNEVLKK